MFKLLQIFTDSILVFMDMVYSIIGINWKYVAMPTLYSENLRWHIVWQHVFLRMEASEVAGLLHVCSRTVNT